MAENIKLYGFVGTLCWKILHFALWASTNMDKINFVQNDFSLQVHCMVSLNFNMMAVGEDSYIMRPGRKLQSSARHWNGITFHIKIEQTNKQICTQAMFLNVWYIFCVNPHLENKIHDGCYEEKNLEEGMWDLLPFKNNWILKVLLKFLGMLLVQICRNV